MKSKMQEYQNIYLKMSKNKITLLITLLISISTYAQQGINYKALIKDDLGNIISGQLIGVQFQIREAAANGSAVYTETHTETTDANGILVLNIGTGTSNDAFSAIDWSSNEHWLNVQIDIAGGTNYVGMSTTQFMAVPYALHALNADNDNWSKEGNTIYNLDDRIGIGSDTLVAKLGIFHDGNSNDPHLYLYENDNDYTRIRMQNRINNFWEIDAYIGSVNRSDRINFWNNTGGNVMTITGDGEVGIDVGISPKTGLHVGDNKRVLFGKDTLGPGSKLMWLPEKSAFRVGTIEEGATSMYWTNQLYFDSSTNEELNYVGDYSFASGLNTRAQGYSATAMGRATEASDYYAMATGYFTNADGQYSTAMGYDSNASETGSVAIGYRVNALSFSEIAVGRYNTDYTPINPNGWDENDRLFSIGNGHTNRSNALTVLKNGTITAPSFSVSEIDAAGDKALITKEYIDAKTPIAYGTISSAGSILSGTGNFTVDNTNAPTFYITVTGSSLSHTNSSASVTPLSGQFRTASITHSNGDLRVYVFNSSGTQVLTTFQFVIYKL